MKKLIPPDVQQCQCLKPNGCTFMTLGGVPALVRCMNLPTVIVKERERNSDGRRGSMSLCEECLPKLIEQKGANYATVRKINRRGKGRKRA